MKNYFILTSIIILLGACNNKPAANNATATDTALVVITKTDTTTAVVAKLPAPVITTYKTKNGKIFTVTESHTTNGMSLSNIKIKFNGSLDSTEMVLNDVDPINKVMLSDLDANGFDEIFIITQSAGSGSAGNVYGYASNNDKSMSAVYMPPVAEKELEKGAAFEGYEGHDEFEIVENSLSRRFPIKAEKARWRAINYKMRKGETGNVLYIKNSTAF